MIHVEQSAQCESRAQLLVELDQWCFATTTALSSSVFKRESHSFAHKQQAPHHPANVPFHEVKGFMQY